MLASSVDVAYAAEAVPVRRTPHLWLSFRSLLL